MRCLGETQVLMLLNGTLAPFEAADADAHIDVCEECRALVADLAMARSGSRLSRAVLSSEPASGARHVLEPESPDVGRRYRVLDLIGQGAMGRVYRAVDRVNARAVALKRVQQGSSQASLAALAQEFRVLATLRHPNIVSVLDYGFDGERRPYFTMELLEDARPLLPAAIEAPRAAQIDLLCQILRALAYLHRHGILHRDLKPTNLLITAGHGLKVLDFGLATYCDDTGLRRPAGTVPYMAPELFLEGSASAASDLYAVGVIAYEVLVGRHPFGRSWTRADLVARISGSAPDLSPLPRELRGVIGRALERSPGDRYRDAAVFLRQLSLASGAPEGEPLPARDSYLVAARFTGRDEELGRLCGALAEARAGRGSAWLVGGESGVGKSRLLEELRGRALVEGVLAVRGQALAGGGTAFHVFRGVLEVLALHVPLSDLEASVIGAVLPNLGALLEREVRPPPEIDAPAVRFRLLDVLRQVIQRSPTPLLILLEDLQWADAESVSLLAEVSAGLGALPLLLVATYREDEAPRLVEQVPALSTLRLDRFGRAEIALLCASMLGPAGEAPGLVDLVARETEGNAYFIVEVMRALAEESGGLDDVGRNALPERILAGGVEQVLERRLKRAPAEARSLLRLAAVAGRQLDLDVLGRFAPHLDALVLACEEAGVLEVHEGRYRYSHDKLRERVLRELCAEERRALHARVAEALEATYPESAEHAAEIADHFREGDRPVEAARHYAIVGEAALARGALGEAEAAFKQAIAFHRRIAPPRLTEARVWRGLAQARFGLGRLNKTEEAMRRVFALTGAPLPTTKAGLLGALGRQIAEQAARRAGLAPRSGMDRALREEQLLALGVQEIYIWLDRPEMFLLCTLIGVNLEEDLDTWDRTNNRAALAYLLSFTKLRGLCQLYLDRAASPSRPGTRAEIDGLRGVALVRINEGRYAEAAESAGRAIAYARARKDDLCAMICLFQLQVATMGLEDFERAGEIAGEIERLAVRTENPRYRALALLGQGAAKLRLGAALEAEEAFSRARAILPKDLGPAPEAAVTSFFAACALMQGQSERALSLALDALGLLERIQVAILEMWFPLYCVIDVFFSRPDPGRYAREIRSGLDMLKRVARQFSPVEPSVALFQGCWELHRGHAARGASSLRRSLRGGERTGLLYDQASARYALGCLARSEAGRRHVPEGAEVHLREALRLFERVGARFEAGKTRAALEGRRFSPVAGPRSAWA